MSTPDQRARDKDRDAAIEIVEAAWADGQIAEADRDKRVEQLLRAQTLGEVAMMTHDLQPTVQPVAQPSAGPPAPAVVECGPSTPASTASATPGAPTGKVSKAVFILPLVVVAVIGVAVIGGLVALVDRSDNAIGSTSTSSGATYAPGEEAEKGEVNVISVDGYRGLVDAVEQGTGGTTAFSAVLYPTYAVVELPFDLTTQREKHYYWDGHELADQDSKSTSTDERFDLRSVDPAVVVRLVQKVRRLADEPTSWYAVVRAPEDDRAMIWAYASNDFDESVYVGARRDGTIVYDSTEH